MRPQLVMFVETAVLALWLGLSLYFTAVEPNPRITLVLTMVAVATLMIQTFVYADKTAPWYRKAFSHVLWITFVVLAFVQYFYL